MEKIKRIFKKMKKSSLFLALMLSVCKGYSQGQPGLQNDPAATTISGPENPHPFNGNGSLGNTYNLTKCGLNYVQSSSKITSRNPAGGPGSGIPVTFSISGLPNNCRVIEQAYIWFIVSHFAGSPAAPAVNVTNPSAATFNYVAALVGSAGNKCWSENGTWNFRTDVTTSITGNGNYTVNIATNPGGSYPNGGEIDGATLFIIYSDANATYQGSLIVADGMITTTLPPPPTATLSGFNACANSSLARAFVINSDFQLATHESILNGVLFPFVDSFYNYDETALTAVTAGQTTAAFGTAPIAQDCYGWMVMGLYYQTTTCTVCPNNNPLVLATSTTPASCSNCNGTATVNPSGGNAPYTYAWNSSPVQNTQTATGLCAGNYTVTVTDGSGCFSGTTTITIATSLAPTASVTTVDANCNQADGSASVSASGGTGPYTYSWAPGGQTTALITNLAAGAYTCTVTDASGCTTTVIANVNNSGGPSANISGSTNITCFGGNNGSATANPTGGSPGYTFSWAPTGGTNATASGLTAGTYTCTITDATGCVTSTTVTLTQPPQLTATATTTPANCGGNNGTATANPTGGTGGYTYAWSPAPGGGQGTANATGLVAGSYTCTITDASGCSVTAIANVGNTGGPTAIISTSGNVTCFGGNNGYATANPSGGTPGYSYSWAPTGGTGPTGSGLIAGNYTCTITDAAGCGTTVTVAITEPTALTTVMSSTTATCGDPDGSASVVAGGGISPYTYSWSSGGMGTTENNLIPGNYTVTVTDAQACTVTGTVTVPNVAGANITLNASSNITCFTACDGSASVNVSGGSAPYTIAWSPTGGNAASAANLCAATYTCSVTDNNGCTSTFTILITEPAVLTVAANSGASICNGQNAQIGAVAAGGTGPYTYTWQPGNLNGATQTVNPAATTTYTVFVTDANGCSANTTETVTVHALPVTTFAADTTVGCSSLCVNFSDLSTIPAPYTINSWSWNFGDGGTSVLQNPNHCYPAPGAYTVSLTVTSSEGCTAALSLNNYINIFPTPTAAFTATPNPASITDPAVAFTDQSTAATSWVWNFGENSISTLQNPSFIYLDTGCYVVQLVAANVIGCADTAIENICISPDWALYIPNCFTPNGDGVNDFFMPDGYGIDQQEFEMWIFDRWGNMIFYTIDISKGWDGKINNGKEVAQIDGYVYKISCKDALGRSHIFTGKISLMK